MQSSAESGSEFIQHPCYSPDLTPLDSIPSVRMEFGVCHFDVIITVTSIICPHFHMGHLPISFSVSYH